MLNRLNNFGHDTRGTFAVMFALMSVVIVAIIGLGLDYWFALNDKTRLSAASDAAGLAAVNVAKAYYAANSGTLTGTALSNAAIAAGIAQGTKVFNVNIGSADIAGTITPNISVAYSNLQFTATVSYSGSIPAHFGPLLGFKSYAVNGTSTSIAGLPKYLDFYIITDVSGSMGIPIDASTQQTLIKNNPDNAQFKSNYPTGCQFACHYSGYNGFAYTQANNIPIKLNTIGQALNALFAAANKTKVISNQFRIGLYTFIVHAVQIASLSSDFTVATTAANNLPNYIDNGTNNNGMGAGGTHFENIWNDLNTYFYPAGKGTSSSDTVPFIILVTDGVDNSQTYYPQNSFTGSYPQLPDTTDSVSFCTKAKAAGYTVAVLYIPYPLIVNPQAIWNDEDGAVNYLVSPTAEPAPPNPYTPNVPVGSNVSNNMNSCASPGYFFTAGTSAQVNAAMQQIFYQAVAATRMSQ